MPNGIIDFIKCQNTNLVWSEFIKSLRVYVIPWVMDVGGSTYRVALYYNLGMQPKKLCKLGTQATTPKGEG